MIDANIIPPLIQLLMNAEFVIRKEAAWAIGIATMGGLPEQIKVLVTQGCVPPLCELLGVATAWGGDPNPNFMILVLEALENILKVGLHPYTELGQSGLPNMMAIVINEADGLTKIKNLQQQHEIENDDIYIKTTKILELYFDC